MKSLEPVHSMLLVQGAQSLWSYSSHHPGGSDSDRLLPSIARGRNGRRNRRSPRGPLTIGRSDSSIRSGRRRAERYRSRRALSPRTGASALSARRHRALSRRTCRSVPLPPMYRLCLDTVFNIDATAVIKSGRGPSGAHSDISHAEVAHLMWQAITNG